MAETTAELTFRGPFSLQRANAFHFGPSKGDPPIWDGRWRLAFALEDGRGHAGVVLSQPEDGSVDAADDGPVQVRLHGDGEPERVLAQVARMLSLDVDGDDFLAVGRRDAVLGELQRAHPGQRPVLFASPYEAAAWSVLSARWPMPRAARVRTELAAAYGRTFTLAGQELAAFPTPQELAAIGDEHPQLSPRKLARLRGVARAALDGRLDVSHLRALGPDAALEELQELEGIGPFYATLIVLRAVGFTDAWVGPDPGRVDAAVARLYGQADPETVAEGWRPFRTWALVLTRIDARAAAERGPGHGR